jgi:hypothetical protein
MLAVLSRFGRDLESLAGRASEDRTMGRLVVGRRGIVVVVVLCGIFVTTGCDIADWIVARNTLFAEPFDSAGDWALSADDGAGLEPGDSASAEISSGALKLIASQIYGCPTASATLDLVEAVAEPVESDLAIDLEVTNAETTAMGEIVICLVFSDATTQIRPLEFAQNSTLVDSVVSLRCEQDGVSLVIDGALATYFPVPSLGRLLSLEISAGACGADGYSRAEIDVEELRIIRI